MQPCFIEIRQKAEATTHFNHPQSWCDVQAARLPGTNHNLDFIYVCHPRLSIYTRGCCWHLMKGQSHSNSSFEQRYFEMDCHAVGHNLNPPKELGSLLCEFAWSTVMTSFYTNVASAGVNLESNCYMRYAELRRDLLTMANLQQLIWYIDSCDTGLMTLHICLVLFIGTCHCGCHCIQWVIISFLRMIWLQTTSVHDCGSISRKFSQLFHATLQV